MVSVVLLMAGCGSRMKMNQNKVLLPLGNQRVFEYPLRLFLDLNLEVVCVIHRNEEEQILPLLPDKVLYTYGGKTRQESVLNGLMKCHGEYVMIHDAARPFIDRVTIETILNQYKMNEAILVYQDVKDTIKRIYNDKMETLPRKELLAAATPQCASKELFLRVYKQAKKEKFEATDDISLIEKYAENIKIRKIPCGEYNFKITTPLDYALAEYIVERKK